MGQDEKEILSKYFGCDIFDYNDNDSCKDKGGKAGALRVF